MTSCTKYFPGGKDTPSLRRQDLTLKVVKFPPLPDQNSTPPDQNNTPNLDKKTHQNVKLFLMCLNKTLLQKQKLLSLSLHKMVPRTMNRPRLNLSKMSHQKKPLFLMILSKTTGYQGRTNASNLLTRYS